MHGVQRGVGGVRARFLIQVLEALAGGEAALGALLGDIQLPPEGQRTLALLVGEQHGVAVMALVGGGDTAPLSTTPVWRPPSKPARTHRGHQAVLGDEGDGQEGKGLGAEGGDAARESSKKGEKALC